MPVIPCVLDHELHLIMKPQQLLQAHQQAPRIVPRHQDILTAHLNELTAFGIATRLEDKGWVVFYMPTYAIVTRLTDARDAYFVALIRPLTLRDHTHICRQAINLRVPQWRCHPSLTVLNASVDAEHAPNSGFTMLQDAWSTEVTLSQLEAPAQTLSSKAQAFLETVEDIIDTNERLEGQKKSRLLSMPYEAVEALATIRSTGDVYIFRFALPPPFAAQQAVRVASMSAGLEGHGYVGTVTQVEDQRVTVRFPRQLDLDHLPEPGVMQAWCSTRIYDIQRDAVTSLRNGAGKNPHLLGNVADAQFVSYEAPTAEAHNQLNAAQRTALIRAGIVPDMLLVLGPPGTGKTHTIRAMVEVEAQHHRRVLVASQSNTAVDNVLEGLVIDSHVRVVRVGNYERTSELIKDYLIGEQARALQVESFKRTEREYRRLTMLSERWDEIERHLSAIRELATRWGAALMQAQKERSALVRWQQAESRRRQPMLQQLSKRARHSHATVTAYARSADRWSHWIERAHPLRSQPIVAPLATLFVTACFSLYRRTERLYDPSALTFLKAKTAYQKACEAYWSDMTASPEVLRLKATYADAEEQVASLEHRLRAALTSIVTIMAGLAGAPAFPSTLTLDSVEVFVSQCLALHSQIRWRHALLVAWRDLLQRRQQTLYSALTRGADVVGSTCIGIATDMRFDDLDFNLAIIDEAGQIAAPDLLVPLARTERAVLVGDHYQLPPVINEQLVKQFEDEAVQQLATKSLFERIFVQADEAHIVRLDTQYRLPALIADFVREQCYEGGYQTGRTVSYSDPLFKRPLVFIDTYATSVQQRREIVTSSSEDEGRGYTNLLEAKIIADLCCRYERAGAELGVIVPYRAQVMRIQEMLLERIPTYTPAIVREVVSTVDSFQGKERDVILFGFTRSNAHGRVGFLREWRRLNVSITRARRQLVLVGDSSTICKSNDDLAVNDHPGQPTFTRMAQGLVRYTKEHGQYILADDIFNAINQ